MTKVFKKNKKMFKKMSLNKLIPTSTVQRSTYNHNIHTYSVPIYVVNRKQCTNKLYFLPCYYT